MTLTRRDSLVLLFSTASVTNMTLSNLHPIRSRLYPYIHHGKQSIDDEMYAKGPLHEDERVGVIDASVEEVRDILTDLGFAYEPIAALKTWTDGTVEDGSYVKRDGITDTYQLHVHIFDRDEGVLVAAHYEYSWITHPIKHYDAEYLDYEKGVEMVEDLFNEADIDYD